MFQTTNQVLFLYGGYINGDTPRAGLNGKSYWMMTGDTPMDWKPPYVTYVFLVKNGMLDYESLREVAVRTRTFIIFQTLNHNACRFFPHLPGEGC